MAKKVCRGGSRLFVKLNFVIPADHDRRERPLLQTHSRLICQVFQWSCSGRSPVTVLQLAAISSSSPGRRRIPCKGSIAGFPFIRIQAAEQHSNDNDHIRLVHLKRCREGNGESGACASAVKPPDIFPDSAGPAQIPLPDRTGIQHPAQHFVLRATYYAPSMSLSASGRIRRALTISKPSACS